MGLNFPANPVVGQTLVSQQNITWEWDGAKWTAQSIIGQLGAMQAQIAQQYTVAALAPPPPLVPFGEVGK
jgi:hypothetical protein